MSSSSPTRAHGTRVRAAVSYYHDNPPRFKIEIPGIPVMDAYTFRPLSREVFKEDKKNVETMITFRYARSLLTGVEMLKVDTIDYGNVKFTNVR